VSVRPDFAYYSDSAPTTKSLWEKIGDVAIPILVACSIIFALYCTGFFINRFFAIIENNPDLLESYLMYLYFKTIFPGI
jgi:hypothetical protein